MDSPGLDDVAPTVQAAGRVDSMFARLLVVIGVNAFAFFLDFVAVQALVIFQWHQGALFSALVATLYAAPLLLVSPWAGAVADRFRQDRILAGGISVLAVLSTLQFFTTSAPVLLALLIVKNVVRTFLMPASMSYLRHSLHSDQVPRALALVSTIQESAKVLGPALSGVLLLFFLPISLYLVVASMYAVALFVVLSLPRSMRAASAWPGIGRLWGDLAGGLSAVLGLPGVRQAVLTALIFTFAIFFSDNLITVLSQELGLRTADYAYFCSAVGVGGLAAATAVARWSGRLSTLTWLKAAIVIDALTYVAIGCLPMLLLTGHALLAAFLALGLLRGVASALQATSLAIYVQSKVGPELAGRANSLHTVIYGASMLSAPLLGNAFFRHASFTMTFMVTAALMLVSLLPLILLHRSSTANDGGKEH